MRSIISFARRVTGDSASQRKWLMLRLVMLLFTAMTTSATWAVDVTFNFTNQGAATQTATDGCKIVAVGTISGTNPSLNNAYIKFKLLKSDFKEIRHIAKSAKCKVKIEKKKGMPFFINKYN